MSTRPTPPAAAVLIPAAWTPEQALAVFELLDELRDRVWAIHGCQIQELLQQEQGFAAGVQNPSIRNADTLPRNHVAGAHQPDKTHPHAPLGNYAKPSLCVVPAAATHGAPPGDARRRLSADLHRR
jgi:hypothetical protein